MLLFATVALVLSLVLSTACKFESMSQQGEEDAMINHFFKDMEKGVYVEIGALDGMTYTNTLKLHTCLHWTGVLIEGLIKNYELLLTNVQKNRPDVETHHGAVCAPPTKFVNFQSGKSPAVGGDALEMADTFKRAWIKPNAESNQVPCLPMSAYLKNHKVINFFSLDVEGAELTAIETIDFKATHIDVMMIEFDGHNLPRNYKIRQVMFNLNYVECVGAAKGSAVFLSSNATNPSWKCPGEVNTTPHGGFVSG